MTRQVGEATHAWHSADMDTPWLSLALEKAQAISQIRVTFDPDLNIEIMISQTKRRLDGMIKGMPPSLVKDFTVRLLKDGETVYQKAITNNWQRLAVIDTGMPVIADQALVEIHSTYGDNTAKIFEVRLY